MEKLHRVVDVYERTGTTWTHTMAIIPPPKGHQVQHFGYSIDLYKDTLVIGEVGNDDAAQDAGALFVYERQDDRTWSQQAKLTLQNPTPYAILGIKTVIHKDTIVSMRNFERYSPRGAVVFVRDGDTWSEQATLVTSEENASRFGLGLALEDDTLMIDQVWTEQAKLVSATGYGHSWFGADVALYKDTMVVGAPRHDDLWENQGSVYIFDAVVENNSPTPAPHTGDPDMVVRKFVLFDSVTDNRISSLSDGEVFDLSEIGTSLNIKAATQGDDVDSVVFLLNGNEYQTENRFPYMLGGDEPRGDMNPVPEFRTPGTYIVTATPYDGPDGTGVAGEPSTITITLE